MNFHVASTNHKIQRLRLEKTFKGIESNPQPTLFQMFLEHFQRWRLHHCPGECMTTLSMKEFSLISNPNLPWSNLRP